MAEMEVGEGSTSRLEIWTDRYRIMGNTHLPTWGSYTKRASDLLNDEGRPFLALTDVTLSSLDGVEGGGGASKRGKTQNLLWRGDFLLVNKASIVLVKVIEG